MNFIPRSRGAVLVASLLMIAAIAPQYATAQERRAGRGQAQVKTVAARPDDVSTIDQIVKAFYEVISGPAGKPREWSRDRTLYRPGVRFVVMEMRNGKPFANVMSHDQYIRQSNDSLVKNGFFETEINRITQQFGNIAHVWSTYEFRQKEEGEVQGRGINTIQLYHDGNRWWITSVAWDEERKDNPIPKEFLAK